jgi:PAS domain S-box-containing protein
MTVPRKSEKIRINNGHRKSHRRPMTSSSSAPKGKLMQLLQEVAVAANQASTLEEVTQFAVDRICDLTGWPVGHVYITNPGDPDLMVSTRIWHLENPQQYATFKDITESTPLRRGIGLPGRVLATGKPAWIENVTLDDNFPRSRSALEIGVKAAFGFPVKVNEDICAVLEFFSPSSLEPDEYFLNVMGNIGTLLARVVERQRAQQALAKSETQYRMLFEDNPQPMLIFSMETLGILAANDAAMRHYGYTKSEFLQRTIKDIQPSEHSAAFEEVLLHLSPRQEPFRTRHRKKNGEIIDVEISTHELLFEGKEARLVLVNDVTERSKAELDLEHSRQQLRALAAHLQYIREEERSSISREIHDELGQVLTGLKMDLAWLDNRLMEPVPKNEMMLQKINAMSKLIDITIQIVRKISSELRPGILDDLGLIPAVDWLAHDFHVRTGIHCEFHSEISHLNLQRNCATAVFRILQETLTNVMRHANATKVSIYLKQTDRDLILNIDDNGRGITEEEINHPESLGLLGMRERALILGGDVLVHPRDSGGTQVTVRLPRDAEVH